MYNIHCVWTIIFAFAEATLALQPTTLSRRGESDKTLNDVYVINPEEVNVLLLAGVEGSGHHYVMKLYNQYISDNNHSQKKHITHNVIPLPEAWACGTQWKEKTKAHGVKQMVAEFNKLTPGKWVLGRSGRMQPLSYPECGRYDHKGRRDQFHPRFDWIAQAASMAGVKLHVLLLYRDLQSCLVADCLHRDFEHGNCSSQSETLASNGLILTEQLKTLDPSTVSFSCLRYGNISSMSQALEASVGQGAGEYVKTAWSDPEPENEMEARPSDWDQYLDEMEAADKALRDSCESMTKFTPDLLAGFFRQ